MYLISCNMHERYVNFSAPSFCNINWNEWKCDIICVVVFFVSHTILTFIANLCCDVMVWPNQTKNEVVNKTMCVGWGLEWFIYVSIVKIIHSMHQYCEGRFSFYESIKIWLWCRISFVDNLNATEIIIRSK